MVLLVGPSPSRQRAKRRTLGYFTPVGWSVPQIDGGGGLLPAESLLAGADEKEERYRELAVQAEAILLNLAQLCREMSNTRGELFMATELVAGGATDMFAVLLPWRRGRIQTLGMPSSDLVSSCSACWNVGNPKGCQSDVGNLDGCPHRVISTGGYRMWNPDAAATATSKASKMNIIIANGIEPAADFRRALGERKGDSALPLVVLHNTDVEVAAGFRNRCASSTRVGGLRDGRCLSCVTPSWRAPLGGPGQRQPRFVTEQVCAIDHLAPDGATLGAPNPDNIDPCAAIARYSVAPRCRRQTMRPGDCRSRGPVPFQRDARRSTPIGRCSGRVLLGSPISDGGRHECSCSGSRVRREDVPGDRRGSRHGAVATTHAPHGARVAAGTGWASLGH